MHKCLYRNRDAALFAYSVLQGLNIFHIACSNFKSVQLVACNTPHTQHWRRDQGSAYVRLRRPTFECRKSYSAAQKRPVPDASPQSRTLCTVTQTASTQAVRNPPNPNHRIFSATQDSAHPGKSRNSGQAICIKNTALLCHGLGVS